MIFSIFSKFELDLDFRYILGVNQALLYITYITL